MHPTQIFTNGKWREVSTSNARTVSFDSRKEVGTQNEKESNVLNQNVVFYPAQYVTIGYDADLKTWIYQLDEDANVEDERYFHKDGYLYYYAPWMEKESKLIYSKRPLDKPTVAGKSITK